MTRRIILASGGGSGVPWEPPPEDMTLDTFRAVTLPLAPTVNYRTVQAGGETVRWRVPDGTTVNAKSLRLRVVSSATMGLRGKWAFEYGGQTYPITFDGERELDLGYNEFRESDPTPAWKVFVAGQPLYVRAYSPEGLTGTNISGTYETGDVVDGKGPTNGPVQDHYGSVAGPVAILGMSADVKCPAFIGDSICYGGTSNENGWISLATRRAGVPGIGLGVPVTIFWGVAGDRWGGQPEKTLAPATDMLCQFSVNDLRVIHDEDGQGVMNAAISCWRWLRARRDVPLYQTTTTPIVDTTNDCATLEGQTLVPEFHTRRQNFIAWLRDGAPLTLNPDTAVLAGGDGVRMGDPEHPLTGIVDVAAVVEEGNTGKWRVDLGPLGGDGVHPSSLGMEIMSGPVFNWLVPPVVT